MHKTSGNLLDDWAACNIRSKEVAARSHRGWGNQPVELIPKYPDESLGKWTITAGRGK